MTLLTQPAEKSGVLPGSVGKTRAADSFDRLTFAKFAIGVASLLMTYYGFWRSRAPWLTWVNNTDTLFLANLYRDLATHAYSLTGWSLTPAPYFVPDMPLFFLASAVTRSIGSAYSLYAAIILTGTLVGFYWIARRMTPSRADRLLAVGLVSLVMFLPCLASKPHYAHVMRWLLAPTGHGGAMLWGLVLLELGLRLLERLTPASIGIFVACVFAAVFSDRLVTTQYLLPIAAVAFLALVFATLLRALLLAAPGGTTRPWTTLLGFSIILTTTVGATFATRAYIHFTRSHGPFRIPLVTPQIGTADSILAIWPIFVADWKKIAGPGSTLFSLMVVSCVAALSVAILEFRGRHRRGVYRQGAGIATVLLIVLVSWAAALAVPVLTCIWQDKDNFRYTLGLLVWPGLLLTLAGAWAASHASPRCTVASSAVALGVGAVFWLPVLTQKPVHSSRIFQSPWVHFIDRVVKKHGLHNGYTGYWQSTSYTLNSQTGADLGVIDDLQRPPRFWLENPNHYCQIPHGTSDAYPIYDFVVCPSLDQKKVIERFGPPAFVEADEAVMCQILIYNRPSDVEFRNLGRAAALDAAHRPLPRQIVRPESLNHMKEEGCGWRSKGVRIIPSGQQLALNVVPPLGGDLLQIMTHARYRYHVEFKLGTQSVGDFQLPAMTVGGMRLQNVVLAPITHGKPFDTIVISPPDGPGEYSVGTVIVLPDSVPH